MSLSNSNIVTITIMTTFPLCKIDRSSAQGFAHSYVFTFEPHNNHGGNVGSIWHPMKTKNVALKVFGRIQIVFPKKEKENQVLIFI